MAQAKTGLQGRHERVAAAVRELVASHRRLGERVTAALWLKTKGPGVWLLEVMPDLPRDERVEQPMEFLPSKTFRFTLNLLLGREPDFRAAIKRDSKFADAVAQAEIVPPKSTTAVAIQAFARRQASKAAGSA